MSNWYTLQVSNHREAGRRIATEAGAASWETQYDGQIATAAEARKAVDNLSNFYRHARAFRGKSVGKLWYGVFR